MIYRFWQWYWRKPNPPKYDTTNQEHRKEIRDRFGKHFDEGLALARDLTEPQILEYLGQKFVQDSINKGAFEYRLQEIEREREAHRHRKQLWISGSSTLAAASRRNVRSDSAGEIASTRRDSATRSLLTRIMGAMWGSSIFQPLE